MGITLRKLATSLAVGAVAGVIVGVLSSPLTGILAGWAVNCLLFCVWTWVTVAPMSGEETRAHATTEDPGRVVSDLVLVGASIASLLGVALLLASGGGRHGVGGVTAAVVGVGVVFVSWVTAHTVFSLHYARLYYAWDGPEPAIDFNGTKLPDYRDFAYLGFTVGMTYQVSDTALQAFTVRRAALRQALVAFLLGAVVLACTINLVVQVAAGG